jgi:hypothetical protein
MPDEAIAAVLNRSGKSTGRGNSWTRMRVCSLRHNHDIAPYRQGDNLKRKEVSTEAERRRLRRPLSHDSFQKSLDL